ncbi:MAG: hypothetical protein LBR86_00900, partial [Tannerella sp.]|nr:hypothetical protein [Tannerella sp.]
GTKLISALNKNLDGKMNKAQIKFPGLFICALCKVQTVSFQKLASAFECAAQSDSSLRRIFPNLRPTDPKKSLFPL